MTTMVKLLCITIIFLNYEPMTKDVLCKEIDDCHLALLQEQSHRQRQLDVLHGNSEACGLTILQEPTDRPGQLGVYLGNPCHSCALEHVKLSCTGFTSRMEIDTKTLSRHGDLCIVKNDKPVPWAACKSPTCIRLCLRGQSFLHAPSTGCKPDVCDIRTSYVSRQCTSSDGDNPAPCLLRRLATPDWLLLAF
ncbi:hypothetical protein Tco_0433436 [Tanacetum coccineum]